MSATTATRMVNRTDVCHHGVLRRKCEPCDLAEELAEVRVVCEQMQTERDNLRERLRAALTVLQWHAGYMAAHNMLGAEWVAVLNDPDNTALLTEPPC